MGVRGDGAADVAAGGNGVASYSRFESALYGAFAGDLRWMLGACDGDWESSAWAHFRALLDARVDAVIDGRDPGTPGPVLVDDDDDGSGDKRKADSSLDGTSGEADAVGAGLLAGLNQSAAPRWPTPEALAAIPPTAEAILDALPLGGGEHRRAQGCLILGRTRELVVDNVLRWLFPGMDPKTLDGDTDEASVHAALVDSPVHSPELLRFAAHLLLFLRELLPDGGGLQPDGSLDRHLNAVVARFVLHLVQSRRYHLVPRYARHLRASLLVETYSRFLTRLAPASAELKARCLDEACAWIPREGGGGVRAIVVRALDDSREVVDARGVPDAPSLSRGPAHRERVLEWATLAGAELHPEAAVHACALIRQLCLQRSAAARLRGCDRPHLTLDPRDFVCGEERARASWLGFYPRIYRRTPRSGPARRGDGALRLGRVPGGVRRGWGVARSRRRSRRARGVGRGGGRRFERFEQSPGGEGARLAAEAATAAIGAIVDLASPRLADSDGFYQPDVVDSFDPGVDGPGYWLDSPALVDAEEAAMETESRSPTVRLVAVALPDRTASGGGDAPRGLGGTDPHETAAALAEALELRVGTIADPVVAGAVRCHVEVTRGCVGEGARAEGAKGQILVEITADIDRLNLPVAPGTPPAAIGAAYDAAAVAARDVVGRARREIALVAADAVKGDLPRIRAAGRGGACADPPAGRPIRRRLRPGDDPPGVQGGVLAESAAGGGGDRGGFGERFERGVRARRRRGPGFARAVQPTGAHVDAAPAAAGRGERHRRRGEGGSRLSSRIRANQVFNVTDNFDKNQHSPGAGGGVPSVFRLLQPFDAHLRPDSHALLHLVSGVVRPGGVPRAVRVIGGEVVLLQAKDGKILGGPGARRRRLHRDVNGSDEHELVSLASSINTIGVSLVLGRGRHRDCELRAGRVDRDEPRRPVGHGVSHGHGLQEIVTRRELERRAVCVHRRTQQAAVHGGVGVRGRDIIVE